MANYNYVQLINKVMNEYDSILEAIRSKNTSLSEDIATETYAGHIGRLTYVKNVPEDEAAPNFVDGLFGTTTTKDLTIATSGALVRDGETFKLNGAFDKDYYVSSSAHIVATLNSSYIKDVTFSGDLGTFGDVTGVQSFSSDGDAYVLTTSNYLIKSVTINNGSVKTDENIIKDAEGKVITDAIEYSRTLESSVALSEEAGDNTVLVSETDTTATGYKITVKGSALLKNAKITASTKTTVEAGYVQANSFDTTIEREYENETVNADDLVLYIPEGGVEVHSVTAADGTSATASITSDLAEIAADSNGPSITLNASVEGALNLKAVYTEGYVKASGDAGETIDSTNIKISDGTFALRKSTVAESTTLAKPTISTTTTSDLTPVSTDSSDDNVYTITVKTTASDPIQNTTVTNGFVTTEDLAKSKLYIPAADPYDIKIKKASGVKATASIKSYTVTGDDYLSDTDSGFAITVKPVLSNTIGLDTKAGSRYGYIESDTDISASVTNDSEKTLYIKAGSVSLNNPTLNLTSHEMTPDDGKPAYNKEVKVITDVFTTTQPTTVDYLKLNTTASLASFNAGYINAVTGSDEVKSVDYYLPKATFAWVKTDDEKDEYLTVLTGGYIPSGTITDISSVEGIEEYNALVTLSLTNTNVNPLTVLPEDASTTDYHLLQVGAKVNAGYISDNTLANSLVNTQYYLKKAKLAATAGISFDEVDTPERTTVTDDAGNKTITYDLAVKATATASYGAGASEGYITAAEIQASDSDSADDTKVIKLNRAVFAETTHTTTITSAPSEGLLGGDNTSAYNGSAYKVTPSVKDCSVAFTVAQSGYISNADKDLLKFESNDVNHATTASPYFIKAADSSAFGIASLNSSAVTSDLTNNKITVDPSSNLYKITVSGKVSTGITVNTTDNAGYGYVGATEATAIAGTKQVDFLKEISIAKGSTKTTVEGSADVSVKDSKINFYSDAADSEDIKATFAEITASATASSTTTITEGYIKNVAADKTEATDTALTPTKKYIKLFETTDNSYSDKDVYGHTVGATAAETITESMASNNPSVTIKTEGKYLSKDTVVTVGDHTIGKAVAAKLLELENRMRGIKTSSNV